MQLEAAMMDADIQRIPEIAQRLERQGFDCGITFEGPRDPFFPVLQSAMQTERLEFATGVAIAFARNPMIVSQIANDLQTLTNGRFILGLGSQIKPHIEKRFSMPWSRPAARMREFVRAIRAIWHTWETGEPLRFEGEFYRHTLMTPVFNPGPNPFGMPRIFVAGVGPKMLEVAVCGMTEGVRTWVGAEVLLMLALTRPGRWGTGTGWSDGPSSRRSSMDQWRGLRGAWSQPTCYWLLSGRLWAAGSAASH